MIIIVCIFEVARFVDEYRDAYEKNPGILEAYGYDAANAVLAELRRGVSTRQDMTAALLRPLVREGATGWTEQNGTNRFRKHLFLLEVRGGTGSLKGLRGSGKLMGRIDAEGTLEYRWDASYRRVETEP